MCYPKPGPRCSRHAVERLNKLNQEYRECPEHQTTKRNELVTKIKEATRDYYMTPEGIKGLEAQATEHLLNGNQQDSRRYLDAVSHFATLRQAKIAEMRIAGIVPTIDQEENEDTSQVQRCENCGRYANTNHTCPTQAIHEYDYATTTTELNQRADVHAPSSQFFDPQGYEVAGFSDANTPHVINNISAKVAELEAEGYTLGSGSRRNCGHCGSQMVYSALMKRPETKQYIFVGETCLDNRFSLVGEGQHEARTGQEFTMTKQAFQNLRRNGQLNRARMRREELIHRLVEEHPELRSIAVEQDRLPPHYSNYTRSISRQLMGQGHLSPAQIEAVRESIATDEDRESLRQGIVPPRVEQRLAEFRNEHPQLTELTDPNNIPNYVSNFTRDVTRQLHTRGRLTPAQIDALKDAFAQDKRRHEERVNNANLPPAQAPSGRATAKAKVVSIRHVTNTYGGRETTTTKMLVVTKEGWKSYLTAPRSVADDIRNGSFLELTATFNPKEDDQSFAFGKNPGRNTRIITEEEFETAE